MASAKASDIGKNLIKSLQSIYLTLGSGTSNVQISPVDMNKTHLVLRGINGSSNGSCYLQLTSPTNVQLYMPDGYGNRAVNFDILEYR